jgi:hypothetical protein
MDSSLIGFMGRIAGIGGLALGVFSLIFREVIRKIIFPKLTATDAYRTIRLLLVLPFGIAVLGILAWIYTKGAQPTSSPSTATSTKPESGRSDGTSSAPRRHLPTAQL